MAEAEVGVEASTHNSESSTRTSKQGEEGEGHSSSKQSGSSSGFSSNLSAWVLRAHPKTLNPPYVRQALPPPR